MVNNWLLPIGYKGKVNALNPHKVTAGTRFKIIGHLPPSPSKYKYRIEFIDTVDYHAISVNERGPFLDNNSIELTEVDALLYGPKQV